MSTGTIEAVVRAGSNTCAIQLKQNTQRRFKETIPKYIFAFLLPYGRQ